MLATAWGAMALWPPGSATGIGQLIMWVISHNINSSESSIVGM